MKIAAWGRAACALSGLCMLLAAPAAAAVTRTPGWTTWGDGPTRLSRATSSQLTARTAPRLRRAWAGSLGGAGSAQPLYLRAIAIRGMRRDIYLAAGERGRLTAFDALTGKTLWKRELGALDTGCQEMPGETFGVTGTPVYDPASGFAYVAATDKLWALDVRSGASRAGWPVTLPLDAAHEHVWGALALGNGHVYLGTASYCDRRPYSGRVLSVDASSGAVDHSWVSVPNGDGRPGGGGIWGWGGIAITADGHVWAAVSNANDENTADQSIGYAQTVDELTPELDLLGTGPSPGMPHEGDYGFGSTPVVFRPAGCDQLVAAEGKDGALYVWRRSALAAGPVQRLVLAREGTLYGSPAWDPKTQRLFLTTTKGEAGVPAGLAALAITSDCQARLVWTRPLGGDLNAVPTVVNDTIVVGTGKGALLVYAAASGKLIAREQLSSPVYEAPIAEGRDVAVVTWNNQLVVYRLAPA
jgi:outer membrane protein assembly factor BamB